MGMRRGEEYLVAFQSEMRLESPRDRLRQRARETKQVARDDHEFLAAGILQCQRFCVYRMDRTFRRLGSSVVPCEPDRLCRWDVNRGQPRPPELFCRPLPEGGI